jgi:hypothetical protein
LPQLRITNMRPVYKYGGVLLIGFFGLAAAFLYWELRKFPASRSFTVSHTAPAAVSQTAPADPQHESPLNAPDVEDDDTRSPEQIEADEQEIIHIAQTAGTSRLEPGLPDKPFGDWLNSVVGRVDKIQWEANDCGENDGSGTQESVPICAAAEIKLADSWQLSVWIAVGSQQLQSSGTPPKLLDKPQVAWIWLSRGESQKGGCGIRLADIPKVVKMPAGQLASQCPSAGSASSAGSNDSSGSQSPR